MSKLSFAAVPLATAALLASPAVIPSASAASPGHEAAVRSVPAFRTVDTPVGQASSIARLTTPKANVRHHHIVSKGYGGGQIKL
jgi:hypothetical protein